jgi:hypothetical protein
MIVADGGEIEVQSGATLDVQSGATFSIADGTIAVADFAIAQGSVVVGDASGYGSALDASADTKVLVGNATTVTSVALSGDVTMDNAGAVTIAAGAVENSMLAVPKPGSLSEVVAFGDFTDNEDTTGYIDLATQIPAGAIPIGFKAVVATGFTGDTTAVVQVGVAGDLDRFSAVTDQSVLAAATVGATVPTDACDGMNAAQTVRVTVTGGADFSSISAGSMTVTLYYLQTV